jgi:hypothetical protein
LFAAGDTKKSQRELVWSPCARRRRRREKKEPNKRPKRGEDGELPLPKMVVEKKQEPPAS